MDKVTKIFIGKVKSVDTVKKTVKAVVSDQSIDRYGEVILASAYKSRLKNYLNNPVLLSSHNYGSLQNIIGKAENIGVEDNELVAEFKYFTDDGNAEADWGWKIASKYGIAAFSVGFLPHKSISGDWEKDGEDIAAGKCPRRTYTDVELLEVSQVTVPANANALGKSIDDDSTLDETSKIILKEYFSTILKDFKEDIKIEEKEVNSEEEGVEELKKLFGDFMKMFEDFQKAQTEKVDVLVADLETRKLEKEELQKSMEDTVVKEMEEVEKKDKEDEVTKLEVEAKEVEDAKKKEVEDAEQKELIKRTLKESADKMKKLFVTSE